MKHVKTRLGKNYTRNFHLIIMMKSYLDIHARLLTTQLRTYRKSLFRALAFILGSVVTYVCFVHQETCNPNQLQFKGGRSPV
jgi:hypothetical protein